MDEPIPDVRQFAPHCPDALASVVARALERDRNRRYQTAAELRQALTMQQLPDTDRSRSLFAKSTIGEILADRQRTIAAAVAELDSPQSAARRISILPEASSDPNTQNSLDSNVAGTARTVPPPADRSPRRPVVLAALVGTLALAGAAAIAARSGRGTQATVALDTRAPTTGPSSESVQLDVVSVAVSAATGESDAASAALSETDASSAITAEAQPDAAPRRIRGRVPSGERNNNSATPPNGAVVTQPERIEM